jgi:uncharacterized membrane protein YdjX (TVP38/TMEM64 family)
VRFESRKSVLARAAVVAALVLVGALVAWSYASLGVVYTLLDSTLTAEQKVQALRAFFSRFGAAAPIAYVGMVVLEVVIAPIPGTMLYAPGGVIFGGFWGGLLSLVGNVLGAGLACQSMRVLLGDRAERFFARSTLAPYEELIARRGGWVVFLLRVNPFTSSDLVSYAAGLTTISVWRVMLGTLAGMAPLCFAQAYLAEEFLAKFPWLVYPLVIASAVYLVVVVWILVNLRRFKPTTEPHET